MQHSKQPDEGATLETDLPSHTPLQDCLRWAVEVIIISSSDVPC